MTFENAYGASLFAAEITPENRYMFQQDLKTGLSIIWNTGNTAMFMIDKQTLELPSGCMMFLTEYHTIDDFQFERMNVIQFNRPFYCVEDDDSEVGCKGALFFGAVDIPKIQVPENRREQFALIWQTLLMELDQSDDFKYEMLHTLLRRFLIFCLRLFREQHLYLSQDPPAFGLIREFNFLVEQHYKRLTKVTDYAQLLHRSPKTISNVFRKHIDKSPLQVINERRFLEARRLLLYTDKSIKEIAAEICFGDVQAFSHFFHQREGVYPSDYRSRHKREV